MAGNLQDANNIAIILAESCDAPEKTCILIEQSAIMPKVMDLVDSRVRNCAEAGLCLLVSLTRSEPSDGVARVLGDKQVASSLFRVMNSSASSQYCKVLAAQWYQMKCSYNTIPYE